MMGRGRNTPHKRRPQIWKRSDRNPSSAATVPEPTSTLTGELGAGALDADWEEEDIFGYDSEGDTSVPAVSFEERLQTGPIPRVSMDYLYLSDPKSSKGAGARGMSTK